MSLLTLLRHADFLELLRQQMTMLFTDSAYAPVVRQFFAAYHYRQAFPGLGESGELLNVTDGLAYALERAFMLYALYAGLGHAGARCRGGGAPVARRRAADPSAACQPGH